MHSYQFLVIHLNFTDEETSAVLPHYTTIVVIVHLCVLHFRCSVNSYGSTDGMHTGFVCRL